MLKTLFFIRNTYTIYTTKFHLSNPRGNLLLHISYIMRVKHHK